MSLRGARSAPLEIDRPIHRGGAGGGHFSPLAQIDHGNVGTLAPRFDAGPGRQIVVITSGARDPAGPQGSAYVACALGENISHKH